MGELETQSQRKLRRDQDLRRERNALTIMPLPVKIPAEWYELLPRVLPLVGRSPQESKFYIADETVQAFRQMWAQRLMTRDGDNVWLRLGGLECYETIPRFARAVENRVKGRDQEVNRQGGLKAVIEYWRTGMEELNGRDDRTVLEARMRVLPSLEHLLSAAALSGAWGTAFERAGENILKIRPTVQGWIAQHGKRWNLDEPFGGKFEESL